MTSSSGSSPPVRRTGRGSPDITEQSIGDGKLYLCAIKDVIANRIVGYFIDSRMKSRLAVDALGSATAHRAAEGTSVAGCIVHADRGSRFRSRKFVAAQNRHGLVGSVGEVGASGDNTAMPVSQVGAQPLTTIRLVGVESQQLLGTVAHRACLCLSGPQVKGAR